MFVSRPVAHVSRASLFENLTLAQDQHLIAFRWIILTALTDVITAQYAYKVNCNTRNPAGPAQGRARGQAARSVIGSRPSWGAPLAGDRTIPPEGLTCYQTLQRAWVGDRRAARMAGSSPAKAPMTTAAARPPAQASGGMTTVSPWARA